MKEASTNMKAVQVLAEHKWLNKIITPALNIERDEIDWESFGYAGQPGSIQTILSWAYCLFCDVLQPKDWGYRDPFDGFFSLDRDIQVLMFKAMALRHGFLGIELKDKPKSGFMEQMKKMESDMIKQDRKESFKIIKPE